MANSLCRSLGQRRGRLVEDQHLAVQRQRLGDLDELLARRWRGRRPWCAPEWAEQVQHLRRVARRVSGNSSEGARRAVDRGHVDILGDRRVAGTARSPGARVPMPRRWLPPARGCRNACAVDQDLAPVGLQDAVDDVHQRRFAGAVLADTAHGSRPRLSSNCTSLSAFTGPNALDRPRISRMGVSVTPCSCDGRHKGEGDQGPLPGFLPRAARDATLFLDALGAATLEILVPIEVVGIVLGHDGEAVVDEGHAHRVGA
jgi:hypothetical protein